MKNYKELPFWKKSINLAVEIYKLVKLLPKEETYALSDQMRRAVVSISSNIAEGQGRDSTKEYIYFLNIARGSCFELGTQLQICRAINYLNEEQVSQAFSLLDEIGKMLTAVINKLKLKSN